MTVQEKAVQLQYDKSHEGCGGIRSFCPSDLGFYDDDDCTNETDDRLVTLGDCNKCWGKEYKGDR